MRQRKLKRKLLQVRTTMTNRICEMGFDWHQTCTSTHASTYWASDIERPRICEVFRFYLPIYLPRSNLGNLWGYQLQKTNRPTLLPDDLTPSTLPYRANPWRAYMSREEAALLLLRLSARSDRTFATHIPMADCSNTRIGVSPRHDLPPLAAGLRALAADADITSATSDIFFSSL